MGFSQMIFTAFTEFSEFIEFSGGFCFEHKSGISDISVLTSKGFKKFQQKIKLPSVGIKLATPTITGLEF